VACRDDGSDGAMPEWSDEIAMGGGYFLEEAMCSEDAEETANLRGAAALRFGIIGGLPVENRDEITTTETVDKELSGGDGRQQG
jgi:hypothetical protein